MSEFPLHCRSFQRSGQSQAEPLEQDLLMLGGLADAPLADLGPVLVGNTTAAQAAGKVVGRPKRVFRRDEVVRLRDVRGLSWRAIGKELGIPAMTALDSYRQSPQCTETVSTGTPNSDGQRQRKTVAA